MINQPFAGQTVWFVFISVFDYSKTDWEKYGREVIFNQTPVGMFSSQKEILKFIDSESQRVTDRIKKDIANRDASEIPHQWKRVLDSKHSWKRVLDFGNQPQIQFWGVDENKNKYEAYPIGEPPSWIKSKRVAMEIWEDQIYRNKIYDASDVYCFVEVVL